MENVKHKIISFWLAHFFLRRIAKRYPDFFKNWVCDITDNRLERKTVIFRYHGDEEDKNKPEGIHPLKFYEIADKLCTVERNVFIYHKNFVDRLISGI